MRPVFHNKSGTLTAYALSCGYIETYETASAAVHLYREHSCWHVRAFNRIERTRCWHSFSTLTQARKFYRQQARALPQ